MSMRYYSSNASKTVLSDSITTDSESITVDTTSGFPGNFPYTLILERETANEEVVEVTGTVGMSLVVTRGFDGTAPRPHAAGSMVEHGVSALDHRLSRQHENASTGVHGLEPGSAVVGTLDEQELSNKSLGTDLDADGHTVKNLADPEDEGDPVPLGWLMEQESNAASAAIAAAASAEAAAVSEANAAESEGNADDSEQLARAWAEKMDGPVVEPDHYSSRWYAQRPPTAVYSPDPPVDGDYPGGLLPGDLWVESDVDTEEFDPISFEERLGDLEGSLGDLEGRGLADLPDVDVSGIADGETVVWDAGASKFVPGSSGGGWPPDTPPTSPSVKDDEFEGDLSSWTAIGSPSTANTTDVPGHLHLAYASSGVKVGGIQKSPPSMPFTVTAKFSAASSTGSSGAGYGLAVYDVAGNKACGVWWQYGSGYGRWHDFWRATWSNLTTIGSYTDVNTGVQIHATFTPYIRMIVNSATSIHMEYSPDGIFWTRVHSGVNPGFTPTGVGPSICVVGAGTGVDAICEWIRFT